MALATIVRKEFLGHVLTLRFVIGAVFTLALFVAAGLVLRSDYADRVTAYRDAAGTHRQALGGAKTFSDIEVEADRPPSPLSVICQGIDRSLPTSSSFSILDAPTVSGAGATRNPLLVVLPTLDLTIVVQVVMSLLALVFAYDVVSGERARGTLALTLANRVPRATLLLGKYLGGMAVLAPLLLIGFAAALVVILTSPLVSLTARDWAAIGVALVVSAAYLSVVFLLGMVISVATRRPGTSLVAALFAWVVLVLLAPPAASAAAAAMRPLPSQRDRAVAEQQAERTAWVGMQEYARTHPCPVSYDDQRQFNRERGSYYSGGVPFLVYLYSGPQEYVQWALDGVRFGLPLELKAAEAVQKLRWRSLRSMASQEELARRLRLLSPAGVLYDAVAALSDTDADRYLRFQAAVRAQRQALLQVARANDGLDWRFFTRRAALRMPTLEQLHAMAAAGDQSRIEAILGRGFADEPAIDMSGLPSFRLPEAPLADRVARAGLGLAALGLVNLLLLLAAVVLFVRSDVRPGGA
jgi:ABC-2 type transport system permease protein